MPLGAASPGDACAVLIGAASDAEFEERWQGLLAMPATAAEEEEEERPDVMEEAMRADDDELRRVLEREPVRERHPPGWGVGAPARPGWAYGRWAGPGAGDESVKDDRPAGTTSDIERAIAILQQAVAQAPAQQGQPSLGQQEPDPRGEAELDDEEPVHQLLRKKQDLANELDDADNKLAQLQQETEERRIQPALTADTDEGSGTESVDELGWDMLSSGSTASAEAAAARTARRAQQLSWAAMLQRVHAAHLAAHRRSLGAHALWKVLKTEFDEHGGGGQEPPPLPYVERWVVRTGRRKIRPEVPPLVRHGPPARAANCERGASACVLNGRVRAGVGGRLAGSACWPRPWGRGRAAVALGAAAGAGGRAEARG
jgi:hypothetical protein